MGLDGPCRLTHVMAEKASLQYAEFRVDFGELLFDVFGDLVVEVDAVAVHRHREGALRMISQPMPFVSPCVMPILNLFSGIINFISTYKVIKYSEYTMPRIRLK